MFLCASCHSLKNSGCQSPTLKCASWTLNGRSSILSYTSKLLIDNALHIVKFLAKMKSLQQNHSELTIGLHMFHRQDNGLSTGWHNSIADAVISKVSFTIVIKFYHHSKVLLFWGEESNMALTGDPLQKPGRCERSWAIFVSYMFLTFC